MSSHCQSLAFPLPGHRRCLLQTPRLRSYDSPCLTSKPATATARRWKKPLSYHHSHTIIGANNRLSPRAVGRPRDRRNKEKQPRGASYAGLRLATWSSLGYLHLTALTVSIEERQRLTTDLAARCSLQRRHAAAMPLHCPGGIVSCELGEGNLVCCAVINDVVVAG